MRRAFAFLFVLMIALPVYGHSLEDLEKDLQKREPYVAFPKSERELFPSFALMNADGRAVTLRSVRGKIVILNFLYTRSPEISTRQSALIGTIQEDVAVGHMADRVVIASITADPAYDTPARMSAYGRRHGLDPGNWLFLTSAQPDAIPALAAELGQTLAPQPDRDFAHSIATYVIDQEGHLRARFFGLEFDPLNLVLYVNALANDVHSRTDYAPGSTAGLWQRIKSLL